ncbi:adenylate/guanylate cyclase domain-containing protein [Candidatus Gracilibacteria bacterium]|nr:adenylate/guanylate cyclase domain-containing protein [Candidatus Gracilibacteria bacterium]
MKNLIKKILSTIICFLIVAVTLVALFSLEFFENFNENFQSQLYDEGQASDEIIIIGIDDKSLEPEPMGFGRYNQWTRQRFISLLEQLENESPKALTFDFIFNTFSTVISSKEVKSLNDNVSNIPKSQQFEEYKGFFQKYSSVINPVDLDLSRAFQKTEKLILGAETNGEASIMPLPIFSKNATLSIVNAIPDSSGTLRHAIPYFTVQTGSGENAKTQSYPDMAVATAKIALGLDPYDPTNLELPTDDQGRLFVNFFGPPNSYKHISFVDVVKGDFEPGTFTDKIVLIGPTSSKQFHDEYVVPTSENSLMSGIEFRANEIQTILEGKFLLPQSQTAEILTILAITLALTLILSATGIILGSVITVAAAGAYYAAAHFFFDRGLILNMVYPFLAIVLTYLTTIAYKYFVTDRHKRQIKTAFSQYVNQSLVDQISENPDQIKLGGENKIVTVFFSDIKDSTALSEKIAIEQWVAQINEYFTVMENLIMQSSGTLDKYEGDAIMAFWNAPISQENHITRAYICAITMKQALKNLHAKWQTEGKPLLEFRIGINTGPAIVGNFGSEHRLDYTAMGDTVNTASRLESAANKTYGTQIIVAGITPEQTPEIALREIDTVLLPGKKEPVVLFEVRALKKDLTAADQELLTIYAQALAAYRAKDFAKALDLFNKLPADIPSQILAARCQNILSNQIVASLDPATMVFKIEHK